LRPTTLKPLPLAPNFVACSNGRWTTCPQASASFDTDSKRLYVEHRWTHVDVRGPDVAESGIAQLDIAEYLNQGGQTAGHRELWRLLKALFHEQAEASHS